MDLPLVLIVSNEKRLVYTIPLWYRIVMGLIAIMLLAGTAISGGSPSILGWLFILLVVLATLYEEKWVFDAEKGELSYRFGLVIAAKRRSLPFSSIAGFRLVPFVRGTLPGSAEEREGNAAALAASKGIQEQRSESGRKRRIHERAYLNLICEDTEGSSLVINTLPARRGDKLRRVGIRIAELCGKALEEG